MKISKFFIDNNVYKLPIKGKYLEKTIGIIFFLLLGVSSITSYSQIICPLFPNGETNASVSCQLRFISQYPSGEIINSMRTSPNAYNSDGDKVSPYFYVVPTANLLESLNDNSVMNQYAASTLLFFDDETNAIIIAPEQPFSYNTNYSVVFNNFPLLRPDINTELGFTPITVTEVFTDYITTISSPLSILDISFQNTGNIVWNINEDIVLHFSKQIAPNEDVLNDIFSLTKVGEATKDSVGRLNYEFISVPTLAELNPDGMSVTLSHLTPFEPGSSYFLSVNWENYLGDDFFNTSYSFSVPDRLIVDVKVHFPNGIPEGEFRHKGYDGQKLFYYGDTVRIGFPAVYENYYLSEWKLPVTTSGTLYQHGELLEIILDENYYFSNAQGNSAFGGIKKTGITIDVYYDVNPIDTLRFSFNIADSLVSMYPNYAEDIVVENIEEKINDSTYTCKRFTPDSTFISYSAGAGVALSASFGSPSTGFTTSGISLPSNPVYPATAISTVSGGTIPNTRDTIIVGKFDYDYDYEKPTACEIGTIKVELNYMGFGNERKFENEMAVIRDMLNVVLTDDNGNKYPVYNSVSPNVNDSITPASQKTSLPVTVYKNRQNPTDPFEVGYNVSLNNSDYEIFLVTTEHGPNKCTVNEDVNKANYGSTQKIPDRDRGYYIENYIYNNYSLEGASAIGGTIKTRNDKGCSNTLRIYIRRKIVEFAFDVQNINFNYNIDYTWKPEYRAPNLSYFRFVFEDLEPINTITNKDYLPKTNFPFVHYDNTGNPYWYYYWRDFIGKDKPISDFIYHRRDGVSGEYADEINNRENVWIERVSVFYYSGESFSYYPYLKPYCGYKLTNMTMPQNSNYSYNPNDPNKRVIINNFKNHDKILEDTELGFILEYIEVPKPNDAGGIDYVKYAVDNYGSEEYGYPIWNLRLYDYDNGLYLNAPSGSRYPLHNNTVSIKLKFNKNYKVHFNSQVDELDASVSSNIEIRDYPGDNLKYTEIRPDGNQLSQYSIVWENTHLFPTDINANTMRGFPGEMHFKFNNMLIPVNIGNHHSLCNLQDFRIKITNYTDNPFLSMDDDILSNVDPDWPLILMGSTIPPKLSTRLHCFGNIDLVDKRWLHDIKIEPYIHLLSEYNLTDEVNPTAIPVWDTLGRIDFDAKDGRYPSGKNSYSLGKNDIKIIDNVFRDVTLKNKQRILHSFHWAKEYRRISGACGLMFDVGAVALKFVAKVAGIDDIDDEIDTLAKLFKEYVCSGDKYLGDNSFWLAKSGKDILKNNQFRYFGDNLYTTPNLFDSLCIQNWNLWGCSTYGMYNPPVKRYAYNITFDYKLEDCGNCCGLSFIDPVTGAIIEYSHFKIIGARNPNFYTVIELWTGD